VARRLIWLLNCSWQSADASPAMGRTRLAGLVCFGVLLFFNDMRTSSFSGWVQAPWVSLGDKTGQERCYSS
jgi:hypothetical protein